MGDDFSQVGSLIGLGPSRITESELISSQADFFTPPVVDHTVQFNRECVYQPMQSLNQAGPLSFVIPGESGLFIDPSTFRLCGKFKVSKLKTGTTGEWENIPDGEAKDNLSVVNLIGSSLFSNITCTLNGVNVSFVETTNTHYKAYLQSICTYGSDAVTTHMEASGFVMDKPGFDEFTTNSAYSVRGKWMDKSSTVDFASWVHCDVLETDRLLTDNMGMTLNFHRARPEFFMKIKASANNTKYKFELTALELRVKKVQLHPKISNEIERRMANGERMRYPITRSQIKIFNVAKGQQNINWSNAIFGQMPYMVCAAMVDQAAFNGDLQKNPYNFQHFNVNDVWYTYNNYDLPQGHYKPDWTGEHGCTKEYRMVNDQLHGGRKNSGDQITYELFKNGCTIWPLDLTPDSCAGYHRHNMGSGTLSFNATFSQPLAKGITVLLYAAYFDEYQIDGNRVVYAVTDDKVQAIG